MRTLKEIQNSYYTNGVKSLNDLELLSLIGINIERCDFLQLFTKNNEELINMGYKPGTARKIRAVSEIAYRYSLAQKPIMQQVHSSKVAADMISPVLKHLPHEEFWVMYMNRANKVIKMEKLSSGGIYATIVDIKMILKRALELLACSMIMVHNHPSGSTHPGDADKTQTKSLKEAAALLDITLIDHIIIAGDNYLSFADEGLI